MLGQSHVSQPLVINTDQNAAYPGAIAALKAEGIFAKDCDHRVCKYLNNRIEQDHRFIKRRVKPGLGFGSYKTACHTLQGYEAMNMICKGQVKQVEKQDITNQNYFIDRLFGLAAQL